MPKSAMIRAECMSFHQNPVDKNQVAKRVGYIPLIHEPILLGYEKNITRYTKRSIFGHRIARTDYSAYKLKF